MSVLNPNSDEEPLECPLCLEYLELDDINFYPCSCGYQICRFCWNKIRTEGNGACPACRSIYSENPADFKPLTREEMAKIKAEKRQKDQAKKQKISENRKHLANVRVVQKNLVFVVGLSPRLSDAEVLRKQEYFGKFGKIHKVVINTSTAYAGNQNQGPSASAYVTYYRSDDALRAIQSVNNIFIDGRTLKASLGTTKYCSHFMKNQPCPKPDCMYLHELGDEAASFTKEEMQQGKHTEYEKNLHEEMILNRPPDNSSSHSNTTTTSGSGGGGSSGAAVQNGHSHHPTQPQTDHSRQQQNDNDKSKGSVVTNNINSTTHKTAAAAAAAASTAVSTAAATDIMTSRTPSPKSGVSSSSSGSSAASCQLSAASQLLSHSSSVTSSQGSSSSSAAVPVPNSSSNGGVESTAGAAQTPTAWSTAGSGNAVQAAAVSSSSYRDNADSPDFVSQLSNSEGLASAAGVLATSQPKSDESRVVVGDAEHQISSSIPTADIRDHGWDPLGSRTESKDDLFGEDDLGFDPFHETQKALAEMLESESQWQPSPPPPSTAAAAETVFPPSGFNSTATQQQTQQLGNSSSSTAPAAAPSSAAAPPPGLGGPMTSSAAAANRAKQPPPGFNMMNFSNSAVPNLLSSDIHGFGGGGGLESTFSTNNSSSTSSSQQHNGFAAANSQHLVNGGRDNSSDVFGFSNHGHPRFTGLGGVHRNPSGGAGNGFPHPDHHRSRPDSGGNGGGGNALDQLQQQFRHMAMQQESKGPSKDWQDGFRALLPNVNVSFGALPGEQQQQARQQHLLGGGDVLEGSSRFNNLPTTSTNASSMLNEVLGVGGGHHSPGNGVNSHLGQQNGHLDRAALHQQQQNMRQQQQNSGWHGMGGGSSHGVNDWGVMDPAIVGAGQLSDHHHHHHPGLHGGHHPHHPQQHHQQSRADSPPNWIKANLEQLTSDSDRGFNIGPLLGGAGGHPGAGQSFSQFNLSSPPPPQGGNQGSNNGGLAGWLANTPPPGFSLNSRTAAQLQQQQQQQLPFHQGMGSGAAAVAASDLESEFQRLIHSK